VNRGLSAQDWRRYYELVDRRQAEELNEHECVELTEISHRIEDFNNRRLECLVQLAALRRTTLPALLNDLGIEPPPVR
jgi:hypothetical protein